MEDSNIIAWLVPSHGNPLATEAIQSRKNKSHFTKHLSHSSNPSLPSGPALQLTFDRSPKSKEGFVFGTDATCDIVLPKLPAISRRHCCLAFDSESRLVLRDFSRNGTAVWYDHQSNGDRRNFSWVLSSGGSYGFPDMVKRIVIDIQTIRFQIVVNDPALGLDQYQTNVDNFTAHLAQKYDVDQENLVPLPAPVERSRPVFIKYTLASEQGAAQTFLWNAEKPWESLIRVAD
jgi:hypothetical protein